MGKKGFVKGLAAGAVLGAVASLAMSMKAPDEKKRELQKAAHDVKDRVMAHAKKLGKLSKSSYDKIVDTTMAEYRGMKALTEDELMELRAELKGSWSDVQNIVATKPATPAKKRPAAKKKAAKKKRKS